MNHDHPSQRISSDDYRRVVSSAQALLDQPPPPTVREILAAYSAKGDGDRDMLLAMFNAKTAEDQRVASVLNLHRCMLEVYQHVPPPPPEPISRPAVNGAYHYPTPTFTQSPRFADHPSSRRLHHRHHVTSASRSPPPSRVHSHLPPSRDVPLSHHSEHPRKRHRSSRSPRMSHAGIYESSHPEQLPPSPYSSSDRSDSAEYSPRSRGSMNIGSLLSTGPSREVNGHHMHERE
ncbi:hypothetical protein D9613_001653 [Agrocybe pediades]|uniref:Uncharacterized protein n=1 Tax=Agrocybe pediades TaxID=84607 RepID=A0A8H4R522_9AGAR|nr:hypothetical protein D9613_001653 [Agrocybe pediades]